MSNKLFGEFDMRYVNRMVKAMVDYAVSHGITDPDEIITAYQKAQKDFFDAILSDEKAMNGAKEICRKFVRDLGKA